MPIPQSPSLVHSQCATRRRRALLPFLFSIQNPRNNSYLAGRACYEVKDADDPLKQIEVPGDSVIRLREGGQGFSKGDDVSTG